MYEPIYTEPVETRKKPGRVKGLHGTRGTDAPS